MWGGVANAGRLERLGRSESQGHKFEGGAGIRNESSADTGSGCWLPLFSQSASGAGHQTVGDHFRMPVCEHERPAHPE